MGPECQINEVRKGPKLSNQNVEQNVKLMWIKMSNECGTKCQINLGQNVKLIWVKKLKLTWIKMSK